MTSKFRSVKCWQLSLLIFISLLLLINFTAKYFNINLQFQTLTRQVVQITNGHFHSQVKSALAVKAMNKNWVQINLINFNFLTLLQLLWHFPSIWTAWKSEDFNNFATKKCIKSCIGKESLIWSILWWFIKLILYISRQYPQSPTSECYWKSLLWEVSQQRTKTESAVIQFLGRDEWWIFWRYRWQPGADEKLVSWICHEAVCQQS